MAKAVSPVNKEKLNERIEEIKSISNGTFAARLIWPTKLLLNGFKIPWASVGAQKKGTTNDRRIIKDNGVGPADTETL